MYLGADETPPSAPCVIAYLNDDNILEARQFASMVDADAKWFCSFFHPMVYFLQRPDGSFARWREYGLPWSVERIARDFENPEIRHRLLPNLSSVPTVATPSGPAYVARASAPRARAAPPYVPTGVPVETYDGPVRAVPHDGKAAHAVPVAAPTAADGARL